MKDFALKIQNKLVEDPYSSLKAIFILGGIAGFAFAFFDEKQIEAVVVLNYLIAFISAVCLFISFFVKEQSLANLLVLVYILLFNVANILIVFKTKMDNLYSFEYIIFFILSSLLFASKNHFKINLASNILCVAVVWFMTENEFRNNDFLSTFSFSLLATYIIANRKFYDQEQLAISEAQYRMLAENSADMICTHKQGGRFDFVSLSSASLIGYTPEELSRKLPSDFIHPDDVLFFKENFFSRLSENQINKPIQYRFRTKSGDFTWVESLIKILDKSPKNGLPKSYLSTTRSFQHHKEFEERIILTNKELEAKNHEIEMFAYITSHDMQEPLRMITNYLQLVQSKLAKVGDTSLNEFIDFAVKSSKNLQTLVKDILTYSTTNRISSDGSTIDIDALLNEINKDLQMIVNEKDVLFSFPNQYIDLKADKNAVRQIFQNIIMNGIKYNKSDQPTINIDCYEEKEFIVYAIEDNGIGIDQAYWTKIFEPFQRLHGKSEHAGTGLGLPICRKIIQNLGGKILLESEVGKGTKFFIYFPKSV